MSRTRQDIEFGLKLYNAISRVQNSFHSYALAIYGKHADFISKDVREELNLWSDYISAETWYSEFHKKLLMHRIPSEHSIFINESHLKMQKYSAIIDLCLVDTKLTLINSSKFTLDNDLVTWLSMPATNNYKHRSFQMYWADNDNDTKHISLFNKDTLSSTSTNVNSGCAQQLFKLRQDKYYFVGIQTIDREQTMLKQITLFGQMQTAARRVQARVGAKGIVGLIVCAGVATALHSYRFEFESVNTTIYGNCLYIGAAIVMVAILKFCNLPLHLLTSLRLKAWFALALIGVIIACVYYMTLEEPPEFYEPITFDNTTSAAKVTGVLSGILNQTFLLSGQAVLPDPSAVETLRTNQYFCTLEENEQGKLVLCNNETLMTFEKGSRKIGPFTNDIDYIKNYLTFHDKDGQSYRVTFINETAILTLLTNMNGVIANMSETIDNKWSYFKQNSGFYKYMVGLLQNYNIVATR